MLYELRIYTAHPGRMPDLLQRFEALVLPLWQRHGIRQAGFWTAHNDADNLDLTYLLAWDALAEREARWAAFVQDPEWTAGYQQSEHNGKLVAGMRSAFLQPTAFSSVQ
jgi:hypothetical protein